VVVRRVATAAGGQEATDHKRTARRVLPPEEGCLNEHLGRFLSRSSRTPSIFQCRRGDRGSTAPGHGCRADSRRRISLADAARAVENGRALPPNRRGEAGILLGKGGARSALTGTACRWLLQPVGDQFGSDWRHCQSCNRRFSSERVAVGVVEGTEATLVKSGVSKARYVLAGTRSPYWKSEHGSAREALGRHGSFEGP